MRTILYARVSHDRTGQQRSIGEQLDDLRRWTTARGWEVVDEIVDNDISASRHAKKKRPGWAKVLERLEAGDIDALAVWEDSRTTRQLGEWTKLRDLMRANGIVLLAGDQLTDFADAGQTLTAGVKAVVSEHEADQTRARIQRSMRANAASGRPHGRRLYGYRRVYNATSGLLERQEPHPDEAPVVRRIYAEHLAGTGIRTIAAGLNRDGLRTSTGTNWSDVQVRRVLSNPAYAGRRVHQGEVVGVADWDALVDPADFDRVQTRFAQRKAAQIRTTKTARLLTGVARCGSCGGRMSAGHDRGGRKVYQCRSGFHVARDLTKLDAYISAIIVERLSRPDVADAVNGPTGASQEADEANARVVALQQQLDDAVDQFTAGELTAATLAKVEQRLLPQIAEAEREARQVFVGIDIDVPDDVATWWAELSDEMRREIVNALLASVTVLPAQRGSRTFDPDAVVVEWRR